MVKKKKNKKFPKDHPDVQRAMTEARITVHDMARKENDMGRECGDGLWNLYDMLGEEQFQAHLDEQEPYLVENHEHFMLISRFAQLYPAEFKMLKTLDRDKMEIVIRLSEQYVKQLGAQKEFIIPSAGTTRSPLKMCILDLEEVLFTMPADAEDRDALICDLAALRVPKLEAEARMWEEGEDTLGLKKGALNTIGEEMVWLGERLKETGLVDEEN